MRKYEFFLKENKELKTEYEVVEDEENQFGMKYGIYGVSMMNGKVVDECCLRKIFFTYMEAELTVEFLYRYKVMPCTAEDVLYDLLKNID